MLKAPKLIHTVLLPTLSVFLLLPAWGNDTKQEMTQAVDSVRPALVRIHVVSVNYEQGRETKSETAGSGVIISPEGYAVTNHHVARDAERIVCTLADKQEVEAKLIGTDALADLAVIKLKSPDGKPFPYVEFGDSSKIEVGDKVFAMGSPYALSQSVTMGIVSNVEMMLPTEFSSEEFTLEGEDVGSIVRWIGHDALIEPGNSGGPLVSKDGKIIGINEISFGLSGAIPSNLVKSVANQLIKNGSVARSWLGIEVQPLLESSGLQKGILVSGVLDDSPAQKAGFASGDIILALNGTEVTARFKEEIPLFNQFVAALPIGKTIEARVLRAGKEQTLWVTTTERKKALEKEHELRNWGICCSNISFLAQKEMQLSSQDGVLVTGVLPSGPAGSAQPPLRKGDVIVKCGGKQIKDVAGLRVLSKEITAGSEDPVPTLVEFERKQKHYATLVRIGKKEETEPGEEASKAWLALDTQVITRELAKALGVAGNKGVRVTQVFPGGNAEKAGIKVGDLIIRIDGEEIPSEQADDEDIFPSMIRQYDIGAEVDLDVVRDAKAIKIKVKLDGSPKSARDYPKYEDENFQLTVRDIAFSDRTDGDVPRDVNGAYIESVAEGGWAALGRLFAGDVITEIDGVTVEGRADVKRLLNEYATKKPNVVVFKVRRGIHTVFCEIKPVWAD